MGYRDAPGNGAEKTEEKQVSDTIRFRKHAAAVLAAAAVAGAFPAFTSYAAPVTEPDGTVFDAEYYAAQNPDVTAVFGTSGDAMWKHYETYGRKEGRKPCADGAVPQAAEQPVLSEVTFPLYPNRSSNRNAEKACSVLDGTVIAAGEEFSYNGTLGRRTAAAGYVIAPVVNGSDYGGGICKISSALYGAASSLGLKITERHAHSHAVPYAAKGKDATVSYGTKDLKFINTSGKDLVLHAGKTDSGFRVWFTEKI